MNCFRLTRQQGVVFSGNGTYCTFKHENLKGHCEDERKNEAARLQSRLEQEASLFKKQATKDPEAAVEPPSKCLC